MAKRIVFKEIDGTVGVIIPSPQWQGTIEELALKDVPEWLEWRVVDESELPSSRNWRDAWRFKADAVDIDIEKAKVIQKELMAKKAVQRVAKDIFGRQDLSAVEAEIEAIDFDSISTLSALYKTWPASIETRSKTRTYKK